MIPGGPCLSGLYLIDFLSNLSERSKLNTCLIDLPNHDSSILSNDKLPLSYNDCIKILDSALYELSEQVDEIILFGQSLGSRLALDLFTFSKTKFRMLFACTLPYVFKISDILNQKIISKQSELDRQIQWEDILPLYTHKPIDQKYTMLLNSNMRTYGNENLLEAAPHIDGTFNVLHDLNIQSKIGILSGENDLVVPNNNHKQLKLSVPNANFYTIPECGHFPMIEKQEDTINLFLDFYMKQG